MSSMLRSIQRQAERNSLNAKGNRNYRLVGKLAKKHGTTRAKELDRIMQNMQKEEEDKHAN